MTKTIYTAGYTSFNREDFVNILKAHHINALIDVRSSPYSAYSPEYNRPELEVFMTGRGIYYRNYAREFGARQDDRKFYDTCVLRRSR